MTSSAAAATAASAKPGPEDGVASAGWPTSSRHSHPGFGFDTVNNFAARLAARSSFLLFAASEGIALPKRVDVGSRRCPLRVAFSEVDRRTAKAMTRWIQFRKIL